MVDITFQGTDRAWTGPGILPLTWRPRAPAPQNLQGPRRPGPGLSPRPSKAPLPSLRLTQEDV